ncbi:hypothetical protein DH2020_043699 [Rehmannia glutinosa]|uniref:Retrotransposon Copia-like N-terminal domain-containing protein n=1 Tax=Rehmannia glutinosa TaxID=99300 RepID=A0ABR0UIX4_REHGL
MAHRRTVIPVKAGTSTANQVTITEDDTPKMSEDDTLKMSGSDHPGMALVTNPLTGNNFLPWSRSVKISLGAKNKLGFIDGTVEKPELDSENYDQWKKVDYMITSWLLNSISKEIVEAFLYADSAKELWEDICQRFGESNGPLLFQLEKEITTLTQGNESVAVYYTKLKKLWDEYILLITVPRCTCGSAQALRDLETNRRLIQFLMGLHEGYDHVRSQILLMDLLPTVNKAYSMILRVEK